MKGNVEQQQEQEGRQEEYRLLVDEIKPKHNIVKNCFYAFLVGGDDLSYRAVVHDPLSGTGLRRN
jgi:hypothetical protein